MRLIDADALLTHINEWSKKLHAGVYHNDAIIMDVLTSIYEYILDMPSSTLNLATIDAEPVVRCKDCKHWGTGYGGETDSIKVCEYANYMVGKNGYCVYGERKMDLEVQDD